MHSFRQKSLLLLYLGFISFNLVNAQPEQPSNLITIQKASIKTDQHASGDKQYNIAGSELENPLVVRVFQNGTPLAGYPVHFSPISHPKKGKDASISPGTVETDQDGFAQARVKLGKTSGEYLFAARLANTNMEANEVYFISHARKSSWVFFLVIGLVGGLAMFLYGMNLMSDGMKKTAGNKMRSILQRLTSNRFIALFVGAFVTMVIQSSSATTVMLVSFVHAGLMSFVQALGVILGSNIGTTITAQIVAFKITDYALLFIAIGMIFYLFGKRESHKYTGEVIIGFGILFLGMQLMSKAMYPLRDYQPFIDMLKGLENPLLGILAGAIFTALVQSSSAFTGIVIVLALEGVLTLNAGIPLILGANVGTCITAGLASITASREARRVAIAHVFFNIVGVLIFLPFVPYFADFIRNLSPGTVGGSLGSVVPRQIANAHTIFNISAAIIFLPFTQMISKLIIRILPDKVEDRGTQPFVQYLDDKLIRTPAVAIDLALAETASILNLLDRMVNAIIMPFLNKNTDEDVSHSEFTVMEGILMREDKIDFLDEKVSEYLLQISRQNLDRVQAKEVFGLLSVVNDMENIGDVIKKDLIPLVSKIPKGGMRFSDEGKQEIKAYHKKVIKQIDRLKGFFIKFKLKDVEKIMKKKAKYTQLQHDYIESHLQRVVSQRTESVTTHQVHIQLMDSLKLINVYIGYIAKTLLQVIQADTHNLPGSVKTEE